LLHIILLLFIIAYSSVAARNYHYAQQAPVSIAVVVLAQPPFWLHIAIINALLIIYLHSFWVIKKEPLKALLCLQFN